MTLKIDTVIWKRADGDQPPKSFETQAPGWYRDDDCVISAAPHQNFAMAAELDGKSVDETAKVLINARLRESTEEQLKAIGVDAG